MKNDKLIRESKSSGKGSDDIYKPKWPLFENLTFLRKSTVQAKSISNLPSTFQSCFPNKNSTQEVQSHSSEMHGANLNLTAKIPIVPIPTVTETCTVNSLSASIEQVQEITTNISNNVYFNEALDVSDHYCRQYTYIA